MYVYSLINNNGIPFYVGITSNPTQRLKSHKNSNNHDKFTEQGNIEMKIMYDTGDNEYSELLAEKIEINMIQFYDTYRYGSNKCVDVQKFFNDNLKNRKFTKKHTNKKRRGTSKRKWNKILKLIHNDPFISIEELMIETDFKRSTLDNTCKKYTNMTMSCFLEESKNKWFIKFNQLLDKDKSKVIKIKW